MLTNIGKADLERYFKNRWLRETMTEVFNAESESQRQRKALLFVEIWSNQRVVQINA
jgi:hypothetical protein